MKNIFRPTISKKIFILTAALSVALIFVSVTVASAIFNARTNNEAKSVCATSSENLREYLESYEMIVDSNSAMANFLVYYKQKIDGIYRENFDEIVEMSYFDGDFADKKIYFNDLVANIFGETTGGGFGMFYSGLSLKNAYTEVVEEMERMSSIDGIISCVVYYYDEQNDYLVYLCDSISETTSAYNFPCSVDKPDPPFHDIATSNKTGVHSVDGSYTSYTPINIDGETVAYVSFYYSVDYVVSAERVFLWTLIGIMLAATAVIVVIYLLLANRFFVKNVRKLSESARAFSSRMDGGELSPVDADIRTHDEIKDLSDDFFALQKKVVEYSDDIAKRTADDERMRAELNIASKIQIQSLPDKPLIAGDMRISSFIRPAKEVGGDLFDYFVTDNGKIFFVIADVSGKGVPAALYMMRGKEIIRYCARTGMSAGKIAETANSELCKNNIEGLFITAFIGIYDEKEGELTFARAGHEQPYLLREGVAEKIGEESNFVLGAFDNMPFVEDSIRLKQGDRVLLYTDGLNEGINGDFEEFGYDRIKEAFENSDGDVLLSVYEKAVEFAGDAEQFDDITMLLIECLKSEAITLLSPTFEDIPALTDKINAFVGGFDKDKISELDVIIDEMVNNYISYAFEGVKKPQLDIGISLSCGVAQLTFTDNGVLFDPLQVDAPDVEGDLSDRPFGGLGISIVKSLADKMTYRVFEGKNRLTIIKDLNAN